MQATPSYILSGPKETTKIPNQTLGRLIFDCLKKRPHNDEINVNAYTGDALTAEKLLTSSVKLSIVFKKMGLGRGDVIAVICENCLNYFIPFAAAFYMGVTVNPLNSAYTVGELKSLLLISKPKLILCSEKSYKTVLEVAQDINITKANILFMEHNEYEKESEIQCFEELLESVTVNINDFEPEEYDISETALIMSSSGTTGHPKGVQLSHENIRSAILPFSNPNHGAYSSKDATVLVPPFYHLFGLLHEFCAVIIGIKVIIMDGFNPEVYLKAIQDYKATILNAVPPLVHFLARSPLVDEYDLSAVKDIVCGGAPLSSTVEKEFEDRFPKLKVRQLYGLTEASGMCVAIPRSCLPNKDGTAGVLIENVLAKIVDVETNKSVCSYKVGEICFKGPMVMKGYFSNPDATKNCFDEEGFLHTGDLGYYDEDGYFYVVDRIKELIKYKGFQVPPAELETLLLSHPAVKDCGVIGISDERAGQVPLAFVVPKEEAVVVEKELVDYVAERISVTKRLYGGVKFVKEIPKTPSGKILRRKLVDIHRGSN
ncbi:hypothetical protein ILUMI_02096 [Ignelater luminosus]|uniref:Luciferin 4-monooxygenase n=1 Tax=Ignelater luminosus TaxID=2038154 RepID=A0A8K0GL46_IGNLU|nr:hypothetical protein ILUMI_02096 [Ignelater luminosus]